MACGYNKVSYTIYNIIIFPLEKVREYMVTKYNGKGFESVKLEDCFENFNKMKYYQAQIKFIVIIVIEWQMLQLVINL